MKETMIKTLLLGVALAALLYFVGSEAGLWGDVKTINGNTSTTIDKHLAPKR